MAATRVRAPISGLHEGTCTAAPETAHYLIRVLRLGVGDRFVAFDPDTAREADATIVSADGTLEISALRPGVTAPRPVTFVQGLAKGDKCDAVVRDATELGVTHVLVAACSRSVVQLEGARLTTRLERWRRIAREAARQCGRADAPRIDFASWSDALAQVDPAARRFCLHTQASAGERLGPSLIEAIAEGAPIAFAAGPEGGLTEDEIALAKDRGWRIASLGDLILRTETAAAAVLGAIRLF